MKRKKESLYVAWKTDLKGNPIEGTDRTFKATSLRNVYQVLAHEESQTDYKGYGSVRCKDGNFWHATHNYTIKQQLDETI